MKLQSHDSQIVGAINDAQGILEASRVYWYSDDSSNNTIAKWPHTSTTSGGTITYTVAISALWNTNNQFLPEEPPTRFSTDCNGAACSGYTLTGWDTSADYASTTTVDDELELSFEVPGKEKAHMIAAQLPFGTYECSTGTTCTDTAPHTVKAYVAHKNAYSPTCVPPPTGGYMRLCGENRHVTFNNQEAIYNVSRIAGKAQDPTTGLSATCESHARLSGSGIAMTKNEFSMAACGDTTTSPSAALRMENDGDPSMVGTFRDGNGNKHVFTYDTEDPTGGVGGHITQRVPKITFAAYQGAGASPSIEALFEMKARTQYAEGGTTYPAGWDIYLMDSSSTSTCHRPVQQRLCRFRQPIAQGEYQYENSTTTFNYDGLCLSPSTTTHVPPGC